MKYANSFASFDTIFTCQQKLPGIRKLDAFQDPGPVFFWASHLECHEMTCGYKDSHILLARTWDEFGLDDFARTDDDVDNKAQIKDLITCCLPRRPPPPGTVEKRWEVSPEHLCQRGQLMRLRFRTRVIFLAADLTWCRITQPPRVSNIRELSHVPRLRAIAGSSSLLLLGA